MAIIMFEISLFTGKYKKTKFSKYYFDFGSFFFAYKY